MSAPRDCATLSPTDRLALREARRTAKLPIKLLARKLGVTPKTLYRWQAGETRPRQQQAAKWREAVS